ncbi:tetratricopeptide repeat protein [Micromonospora tulbaghiae]|uniref:Tetratricopeptide repeat protein n=1 Tax=Micromonospora tulbaghiae TaxID=479978 RepID=A0AAW4JMP9_9ACTN|nr:tetratricopeptide repeat protein [Micromonospora tulbaghiae]MBO4140202.1 tetratricopeptide repeat protein [Micromonospora tulbaghiae]
MQRVVRPQWWHEGTYRSVGMRSHLARHDIGAVFGFLKERGFSWSAIASATGLGASRVSEIASGRRIVTDYSVLERIAEGLRIPRHYMGLALDDQAVQHRQGLSLEQAVPTPPLDPRELLGVVASIAVGAIPAGVERWLPTSQEVAVPAVVGQDEVATVRAVTAFHRRLDAAAGGGRCLQSARGYVAWATQLLQVQCNDVVAAELRAALAELHNLVGWVAHDLDDHDMARRHLTQSLVLARQTDSLPLLANTLYRLGRVSLHQEQPAEALQLFGLGQLAAQQAGCHASVGILHANSAWAYALLGADHQVVDSLTRARRELDQADPDTAPAWTHFALTEADVHGISAVVYSALARHPEHVRYVDRASEHSHQAVRLRRPQDRRSFIFDTISVATASILAGDLGTAGEYGMKAVGLVADGMRSARVNDRLNALWELAAPQAAREPALAALGSRIAELQAV